MWNVFGSVIPSLIAIPAMGMMARLLGVEKFGLFTLAFAIIGYASIFDAGLTRAVVRSVSINRGDNFKIRQILGTSTWTVIFIGLLGTCILWFNSSLLANVLNISSSNFNDAVLSFKWLSTSIMPFLLGSIWFSHLEGNELFRELNILKTISSSFLALSPLVAVLVEKSLTAAVIGLVIGRIFFALLAFRAYQKKIKTRLFCYDWGVFKDLIAFGGWITVSNIISPIMAYFDRFILSNIVGANSVAFYTAPAEAIARLAIVPNAVSRAIYPKLSQRLSNSRFDEKLSFWGLLCACLFIALPLFIFTDDILLIWLGKEYLGVASIVFKILLIGFVFNSIARIPYTTIQARGYSRVTAIIHLVELLPYLALLYLLIKYYALVGAAMAWSIRVFIDFIILQYYSFKTGKDGYYIAATNEVSANYE